MRYPASTKAALLGAAGGVFAVTFISFSQFGCKTSHGAATMVEGQADAAAVTGVVPFWVAKPKQASEQVMLAKIKNEDSAFWRSDLVMQAGWATVGTGKPPVYTLASAGADWLRTAKAGA